MHCICVFLDYQNFLVEGIVDFWKHYDPDISCKYEKFYGCH